MEVPELEPGTQRCGRYVMPFHHTPINKLGGPDRIRTGEILRAKQMS